MNICNFFILCLFHHDNSFLIYVTLFLNFLVLEIYASLFFSIGRSTEFYFLAMSIGCSKKAPTATGVHVWDNGIDELA